jgi:hypothetical protein
MIDHPGWIALQQHVARNAEAYIAGIGALFVASVCAMPAKIPASVQEFWTWLRDSLQIAVPAARSHTAMTSQTVETPQGKVSTSTSTPTTPTEETK